MTTTNNSSSASVNTGGLAMVLLTIALGVAKVTDNLDISWWIVFLPMYAGFLLFLLFLVLVAIAAGIMKVSENRKRKKRAKELEARRNARVDQNGDSPRVPAARNYLR